MFITLAIMNARVTDLSLANYIPVVNGEVVVFKQFATLKDETEKLAASFPQSYISVLKIHYIARSSYFLGKALKVVPGSPGATDFLKIRVTEVHLVEFNSRQLNLNSKINKVINALKGDLLGST